jgi:hypothetical protein
MTTENKAIETSNVSESNPLKNSAEVKANKSDDKPASSTKAASINPVSNTDKTTPSTKRRVTKTPARAVTTAPKAPLKKRAPTHKPKATPVNKLESSNTKETVKKENTDKHIADQVTAFVRRRVWPD